jgi:hypothetical protein
MLSAKPPMPGGRAERIEQAQRFQGSRIGPPITPTVTTNAPGSGNPFAVRACVRGYVAASERPAVPVCRSNLKWRDHRLKVPCNDYFGAQGTDHQTP